jgi:hypothetical protein
MGAVRHLNGAELRITWWAWKYSAHRGEISARFLAGGDGLLSV